MNMRKFTIDTFLSHCQSLELRRKWFAIRRDEKYGKCKISRLDGNLRVAEYILCLILSLGKIYTDSATVLRLGLLS